MLISSYLCHQQFLLFLDVSFVFVFCGIVVKDYRQPMDLLKLSFPLTSPAMFRRFGFKWKETTPFSTRTTSGYGSTYPSNQIRDIFTANGIKCDNSYIISVGECIDAGFDPIKLAKDLKITI